MYNRPNSRGFERFRQSAKSFSRTSYLFLTHTRHTIKYNNVSIIIKGDGKCGEVPLKKTEKKKTRKGLC